MTARLLRPVEDRKNLLTPIFRFWCKLYSSAKSSEAFRVGSHSSGVGAALAARPSHARVKGPVWRLDIQSFVLRRKTTFPASIPVVDLVSEFTPYSDAEDKARQQLCHKQFAAAAPDREGIVAYGSGRYIFQDNPPLVVESIIKIYGSVLGEPQRSQVLERGMALRSGGA